MFPETLCSLTSSNKDRIPFAQGRYNMGGSGSLRFCGPEHLQLIVSRRNPHIPDNGTGNSSGDAGMWGFTVVRREPELSDAGDNAVVTNPHRLRISPIGDLHPVDEPNRAQPGDAFESHANTLGVIGQEADRPGVTHPLDVAANVSQVLPHHRRSSGHHRRDPDGDHKPSLW